MERSNNINDLYRYVSILFFHPTFRGWKLKSSYSCKLLISLFFLAISIL